MNETERCLRHGGTVIRLCLPDGSEYACRGVIWPADHGADAETKGAVRRRHFKERRRAWRKGLEVGGEVDAREETADEEDTLGGGVWRGRERRDAIRKRDGRRRLAIGHHAVLEALAEHGVRYEFGKDALVVEHESPRGEETEVKLAGGHYEHDGNKFSTNADVWAACR